ncbi:MAG: class I SAM-dependent methyltransferase [Candidatus Adiutrix sp.]|jgi:16S rRNA (guanine527-N7)-methyltransferase|nr:class I SAM-dependent methyltransferase [Candidatus Adiutrix sp.]
MPTKKNLPDTLSALAKAPTEHKKVGRDKNLPETLPALAREFERAGLKLSPREAEQFWRLHQLLIRRNPAGDLTRVSGFYNLVYKHYIDGAMAAELINPVGLTMDLGSGAGFPGLPLAIRRPAWPLMLAEPRGRRLAFMEEAVALLGLEKVEFYPHKVGPRFDRNIENFITRDFEAAAASLRRAAALIPPGGRVYLMKGPRADEELRAAEALAEFGDFETEDDRAYLLGPSGLKRRLITWRKKDGAARAGRSGPPPPWPLVEISSRENPRYKNWLKILSGRGLKKSGEALISGRKFVAEILAAQPGRARGLIVRRLSDLDGCPVPDGLTVHLVRPELFPALDLYGAGGPLLLLERLQPPAWDGRLPDGLTVFLPFQDPANLGAAIRTSAALGATAVLLKEAASPWRPKSLRAAGPAVLLADLRQGPSLAELARQSRPGLMALTPTGQNILDFKFPAQTGFLFGLEGPGLAGLDWPADRRLSIPMRAGVESLNAAAALAVALGLWAARR